MIKLVSEYSNYLKELLLLIKKSPFKTAYLIEKLEIPKPTFYRKLKDNSFTVLEVEELTKILFPKEGYLKEIKETIDRSRKEIEEGNYIEHSELMKEIKEEFL